MASFRRANEERVNAFRVDDRYVFKHYFEQEAVFDRLRRYYNNHQYRFEVPPGEFDTLRSFLSNHGYALVVVEVPGEFVVAVRKYTEHPENIFKESVMQRSVPDYNCFLMTDQEAVEAAVRDGARRLDETDIENPF
ncbi:hypothetical protein [Halobellus rubicundus]|uniref:Uncharacterized protein n=1 Tax=Halobellus rubicundus TaxID=2996466 RepID=A0ABD5MFW2_9EURY